MEVIHEIIRESVSGGFWKFAGYCVIILIIVAVPLNILLEIVEWVVTNGRSKK